MTPERRAWIFTGLKRPTDPERRQLWQEEVSVAGQPEKARKLYKERCDNARKQLPPWAYHRDWLNGYALEHLPRVIANLGFGRASWAYAVGPNVVPGFCSGRLIFIQLEPGSTDHILIDRGSGEWAIAAQQLRGEDLIELVERRLRLTPAKAAWRLAQICGLRSPMP